MTHLKVTNIDNKKTGEPDYTEWADIPGKRWCDGTSYTVTGLENGSTYTFGVRGINDGGYGSSGPEFPFAIPQPPAPDAPQSLTVSAGNGEVTLNLDGTFEWWSPLSDMSTARARMVAVLGADGSTVTEQ